MSYKGLDLLADRLVRIETAACGVLVAVLVALILLNVITRAFNVALFWVDELAIQVMVWMAFIGTSVLVRKRGHVSVRLGLEKLSINLQRRISVTVDVLILLFAAGLCVMCWFWYDPLGVVQHGFHFEEFAADTYNFIYQEPTNSLGFPKFWIWLVLPFVSVSMTIHAMANLLDNFSNVALAKC